MIPGDMAMETRRLERLSEQRRRDCRNEYAARNCEANDNADVGACEALLMCAEDGDESEIRLTYFRFVWNVLNDFFYFLTPKAAGMLGVVSAVFLYVNLLGR
jgi:hypothetical protein